LLSCTRCGALGTVWPDDCPGRPLLVAEIIEINAGILNFRNGTWCGEPSMIMQCMRAEGAQEDERQ
jgi:hypothetical protein